MNALHSLVCINEPVIFKYWYFDVLHVQRQSTTHTMVSPRSLPAAHNAISDFNNSLLHDAFNKNVEAVAESHHNSPIGAGATRLPLDVNYTHVATSIGTEEKSNTPMDQFENRILQSSRFMSGGDRYNHTETTGNDSTRKIGKPPRVYEEGPTRTSYKFALLIRSMKGSMPVCFTGFFVVPLLLVIEFVSLCFFSHLQWISSNDNHLYIELLLNSTYLGVIMGLGATFGSQLLLHQTGVVHTRTSREISWDMSSYPTVDTDVSPRNSLLEIGAIKAWNPLVYYGNFPLCLAR
ncbi:unnamed protein product [Rhizoctonia solani]|uniref:Uncharacterized protein n=1 Tax=Rhizoctonia solani TaxID=456999 RepID=A0A8H3GU22_9AGAM|nr:unnamed protein product [Rhizoctonia solani]